MFKSDLVKGEQVKAAIRQAVAGRAGATVIVPHQNRLLSFRARLLTVANEEMILEPVPPLPASAQEIEAANPCRIVIRHRAYRYVCDARLRSDMWNAEGEVMQVFRTPLPSQLNRYERRAHPRVDVPGNKDVRAHIWMADLETLSWSGPVMNLSEGGLQMRTQCSLLEIFEAGDLVSLGIKFGLNAEPLKLNAHFRGGMRDGDMAMVGFEFVETNSPREFAGILETIVKHIQAFG